MKTWQVNLPSGEVKEISGDRVEFNPDTFSVVFYNGDSVVGAFINFHSFNEV